MKVTIDENRLITAYSLIGDLANSIEVPESAELIAGFVPGKFKLNEDNSITQVDQQEATPDLVAMPSALEQVAKLTVEVAKQKATYNAMIASLTKELASLKGKE